MVYLIVLTLIISLLALFAVIILYIRQNRLFHIEKRYKQLNDELEASVSAFIIEMKEENEAFINKIKQLQTSDNKNETIEPVNLNIERNGKDTVEYGTDYQVHPVSPPLFAGIKEYQKAVKQTTDIPEKETNVRKEDPFEAQSAADSDLHKIKQLLNAGYSIDEIAKTLHKGKTEIELLIKFSPDFFN
ncbi:DUF6115 domain-containing protein [Caldibacillus thermoamylovorans]|uniref:DUF6115 domain-containing protein n=1 Tax=Caldibacillus thermoamylovorans TaxID=35841 RepID=UPI00203BC127|nr:hypothetical protein [Caldibacillus thermoamylovorans]MCM3053498.1 hypothetical protein [Caldibacillus thermoamylovorans]